MSILYVFGHTCTYQRVYNFNTTDTQVVPVAQVNTPFLTANFIYDTSKPGAQDCTDPLLELEYYFLTQDADYLNSVIFWKTEQISKIISMHFFVPCITEKFQNKQLYHVNTYEIQKPVVATVKAVEAAIKYASRYRGKCPTEDEAALKQVMTMSTNTFNDNREVFCYIGDVRFYSKQDYAI